MNDTTSWLKANALWLLLTVGTVFTFVWLITQRKKLKTVWYSAIPIAIIHTAYGLLTVKAFAFLESGFSKNGFNGMSIFGALFMMPLAYWLCAKLFKRPVKTVFDIMTPCMLFTLMCARVNCIITGCCFGAFIPGTDKTRFPTREAEILFYIILLIIICTRIIKEKNNGEIYPLYMICYGAFRFVTEFFRYADTSSVFHISHLWSILTLFLGISIYAEIDSKKKTKEEKMLIWLNVF